MFAEFPNCVQGPLYSYTTEFCTNAQVSIPLSHNSMETQTLLNMVPYEYNQPFSGILTAKGPQVFLFFNIIFISIINFFVNILFLLGINDQFKHSNKFYDFY